VLLEQLLRQTDGSRLIVSLRAVLDLDLQAVLSNRFLANGSG